MIAPQIQRSRFKKKIDRWSLLINHSQTPKRCSIHQTVSILHSSSSSSQSQREKKERAICVTRWLPPSRKKEEEERRSSGTVVSRCFCRRCCRVLAVFSLPVFKNRRSKNQPPWLLVQLFFPVNNNPEVLPFSLPVFSVLFTPIWNFGGNKGYEIWGGFFLAQLIVWLKNETFCRYL